MKHIKQTPAGFIVDEFLPNVGWAGGFNSISCAAGHHLREGRWLLDPKYMRDYTMFWLRKGGAPRLYSFWIADSVWQRYCVTGDRAEALDLLPDLIKNYQAWENEKRDLNGLYWQIDDRDGGELSIGGSGYRVTINSYQYGDARAIARIAELAGKLEIAREYNDKAAAIKGLVQQKLWDDRAQFFKVLPKGENDGRVVPWIDENLNPTNGDWISRTRLKTWKNGTWDAGKGGEERGKDYNHSTYCDLVISGLIGLRPRADDTVEVNPLVPVHTWDYFCLDRVPYHGHLLTIFYDKTGERYNRGKGLRVLADGKEIAASATLAKMTGVLPGKLK
ncbi:MAG: glycosyl hydrolase family 65 protein [Verrucomicrobiota bacterium]